MDSYQQTIFSLNHRITRLERIVANIMLGRKPCAPPVTGGGGGGTGNSSFVVVPDFGSLPNPGDPNNIYFTDDSDIMWYWDGSSYIPLFDPAAYIQNQNVVNQSANFRIAGTGTITSSGAPVMELTQTTPGQSITIPFHTPDVPNGLFTLGVAGKPENLFQVYNPATNAYIEVGTGKIIMGGIDPATFGGQQSLIIINDFWLFKNYNNSFFNMAAGPNAIGIYDSTAGIMRFVIKGNGNVVLGNNGTTWPGDNGARLQIETGTLSLGHGNSDYPQGNGFMFYRDDTNRFRVGVNGAWKDLATMDDVAGAGGGVTSFNSRIGAVLPQAGDYTKAMVGLGNVDDTSDANKPVSTAQAAADNLRILLTEKANPNGVATLDSGGKVPASQLPFTSGSFIQNQNAVAQNPGNYWIQGTGKITSNGVPSMEWHQQAGAGYGVFIPFSTSTIPLGYFSLGDSGLPQAFINVSIPSTGKSVAISEGIIEFVGWTATPPASYTGAKFNDFWIAKNYNNNVLNTDGVGGNSIIIRDNTENAYRVVIKQNGNWIIGGGVNDNNSRLQIVGGPVSLNPATADPAVGDGFLFYRSDTGKMRAGIAGAWQNLMTETAAQAAFAPKVNVVPITTSPYTIQASDDGQILDWRGAGTLTLFMSIGLRIGFHCEVHQSVPGAVTFTSNGLASVTNRTGSLTTAGQYAAASLRQVNTNSFRVQGDLV